MTLPSILVTGAAGFIGSHVCETFLAKGHPVIGLDNFNSFYDPAIKKSTVNLYRNHPNFTLITGDIRDNNCLSMLFKTHTLHTIIHLAAMASVRPSIQNPRLYHDVNITGTLNLLDQAHQHGTKKFLFASSSSVYGNNPSSPFRESDAVDHPISPYASTKKSGELLCYTYHHLYQLPIACLRFFTVYGPRQRPEMAIHKFAKKIQASQPLDVYNHGHCERDYTYIDDIVAGIYGIWHTKFSYDIINLGESDTITTTLLIKQLETLIGKTAIINPLPAQPGDVERTYADITKARTHYGYNPTTPLSTGLQKFVAWFNTYNTIPTRH